MSMPSPFPTSQTPPQKPGFAHRSFVLRFFLLLIGLALAVGGWWYRDSLMDQIVRKKPAASAPALAAPLIPILLPERWPMALYGHPMQQPPAQAKQIVLVLLGAGDNPALTEKALQTLPREVTIALSPHIPNVSSWAQKFYDKGHDILVSLPLEPENFPLNDPGPHTLLVGLPRAEMEKRLAWALEKVPYAIGVTHETGHFFTTQGPALRTFFQSLNLRKLFFLDTLASPETRSFEQSAHLHTPCMMVDRPFSLKTLGTKTAEDLKEDVQLNDRLIITLPLCETALSVIKELSRPPKHPTKRPASKNKKTHPQASPRHEIFWVRIGFALQNPR